MIDDRASRTCAPFPWCILIGGVLLACLYLPTLATRFDFVDDGNLVYPSSPMPLGPRLQWTWEKTVANYTILGPFRPVLWCHWEFEAEAFGGNPIYWRLARLGWTSLAAGMFLWFMRELGIRPAAALAATALAMWNPYRNEIWTSLTLAEGVAMPYAVAALVCVLRAGRSAKPWRWDLVSALCMLAALGCKNTFAALVPAQIYLRVVADGSDFVSGLRRHGWRAGALALSLLLPAAHYAYFVAHWHPGQYALQGPSWTQAERILHAVSGAMSPEYVGIGLVAAVCALVISRYTSRRVMGTREYPESTKSVFAIPDGGPRYRATLVAGLLLLTAGMGAYLPINAVSGRYAIPAAWGVDLLVAAQLSAVLQLCKQRTARVVFTAFACGLVLVAVANVGHQQKVAARTEMLWDSLEWVEERAPAGACVAWQCSPTLGVEEGIHFNWHLQGRGRKKVSVVLVDEQDQPISRPELPLSREARRKPDYLITGASISPGAGWQLERVIRIEYWKDRRSFECSVWTSAHDGFVADASKK
jgi:hypothetical protein